MVDDSTVEISKIIGMTRYEIALIEQMRGVVEEEEEEKEEEKHFVARNNSSFGVAQQRMTYSPISLVHADRMLLPLSSSLSSSLLRRFSVYILSLLPFITPYLNSYPRNRGFHPYTEIFVLLAAEAYTCVQSLRG